ncbi:MAG: GerMN domain-containing protein [Euzebya sp.]
MNVPSRTIVFLLLCLTTMSAACSGGAQSAGPVPTAGPAGLATAASPPAPGEVSATPSVVPSPVASTTTGSSTDSPLPGSSGGGEGRQVTVFFVADGTWAAGVQRTIPGSSDVAANTIRALLAGPTPVETAEGLSSSIPADTLLLGISIRDGLASIDLSQEFENGGGSFNILSRLAQVTYTLAQFPTVDAVAFRLDGQPVTVFSGEGVELGHPVRPQDYTSLLPLAPAVPRWGQPDLPSVTGVSDDRLRRVGLVAADDVLNVRSAAGAGNPVIGMLQPGVVVRVTGVVTDVAGSEWAQIDVPGGPGWVNDRFLIAVVDDAAFAADLRVNELLDRLSSIMAAGDDLSPVVSRRGLAIAHFAPLRTFDRAELATLVTDPTTYAWGSAALEPDSPELPRRTFGQAVAQRFVSTYDDADTIVTRDDARLGGNGTPAEFAIPAELSGLHFVSVYDSGDNPEYGGLDWTAWYVSIDYEDGQPVVVAMTLNEWSP